MEEYKLQFQTGQYQELGHLGADLDNPELMGKRAVADRVRSFSKQLREVNKARTERSASEGPRAQPKASAPSARQRALEFAKKVPRPKFAPQLAAPVPPAASEGPEAVDEEQQTLQALWAEIEEREEQHRTDRETIGQMKDRLATGRGLEDE